MSLFLSSLALLKHERGPTAIVLRFARGQRRHTSKTAGTMAEWI